MHVVVLLTDPSVVLVLVAPSTFNGLPCPVANQLLLDGCP